MRMERSAGCQRLKTVGSPVPAPERALDTPGQAPGRALAIGHALISCSSPTATVWWGPIVVAEATLILPKTAYADFSGPCSGGWNWWGPILVVESTFILPKTAG
jgi:hypothetical protein